jgi:protein-S-isoprenylcysteine O-methyltransferase Ste14
MDSKARYTVITLSLLALAVGYTIGTAFFTIELERLFERTLTPAITESSGATALSQAVMASPDAFMQSNSVRIIGGVSLALIIALTLVGFAAEKQGLSFLGGFAFFLTTYAYFVIHMSFLAGLQVLVLLWRPFWGDWVRLGDIVYLPYMILVYPFALLGVDIRADTAHWLFRIGLIVFALGTAAWFYARFQRKGMATFWIYRYSRHPQYLGWVIWSYSLMLRAALSHAVSPNPGTGLPWMLSTLILVWVALGEEIRMSKQYGPEYESYRTAAPFLFPLPRVVSTVVSAPMRLVLKKNWPENNRELVLSFGVYAAILILLSLPFALLGWPPGGWGDWPAFV